MAKYNPLHSQQHQAMLAMILTNPVQSPSPEYTLLHDGSGRLQLET